MEIVYVFFGFLFYWCYQLCSFFPAAILLVALLSKLLLLPISIRMQKSGIKLVKMQPEINRIKTKFFGDGDRIAEEQSRLFKEAKYNPFSSVVPLFLQIILLLGLIEVIYHPITYLFQVSAEEMIVIEQYVQSQGAFDFEEREAELHMIKILKNNLDTLAYHEDFSDLDLLPQVEQFQTVFLGLSLVDLPLEMGGIYLLVPILAGLSSVLLCFCQNKANVLQSQQSKRGQWGTTLFSVGLSTYLGLLVPVAVAFYWVCGNVLAVIQLYTLNFLIDPKKYVDYEALEATKKELDALESLGEKKKLFQKNPYAKREKEDYKRFFSIANKHLVFYSEGSGFYKYFQNIIEELLKKSNVTIHYVTNDPDDQIFNIAKEYGKIKPYYIGKRKIIPFFMKMDAEVVVMTTPELETHYLRKSYVKKDIEYIYIPHGMTSTNMVISKGAYDHFDTILCVGQHQIDELRESEKLYGLKEKRLIPCGFGMFDNIMHTYSQMENVENHPKKILIAPSWQEDNLLDSCVEPLIDSLLQGNFSITLRPHPEYKKRYPEKMNALLCKYESFLGEHFIIEQDFSSNVTIFTADLLITDWSGIAHEFSYCTKKPSLFINTPPKILNTEYVRYKNQPIDLTLREELGQSLALSEVPTALEVVEKLLCDRSYQEKIREITEKYVFCHGESGSVGAEYILSAIIGKN